MTSRRGTADPDRLAALEEERDFLLASIDDLDAEAAAGDLDDTDHATLRDDYTRRAAEVIRAIDEQRDAFAGRGGMSTGARVATLLGVVIVAAVVGVMLARSVGFRSEADTATGGASQSTAGLLAEAETLTFEREWEEAIEVYDLVLDGAPSNVEALTYRGWLLFQTGDTPAGLDSLADAVAADPGYPDARVFRALVFRAEGDLDAAREEVAILDGLPVDSEVASLLDAANLRADLNARFLVDRFGGSSGAIDLGTVDLEMTAVVDAAEVIDANIDASLAIRLRDAVLADEPDNAEALLAQGRRLATSPDIVETLPEAAARGVTMLDRAIGLEPDRADGYLWRSVARALQGDIDGADADLAVIDTLSLRPELAPLLGEVRAAVDASRPG